ncbi:MAG: SDR family oxidoreductase [Chloroflexi bacterium]|nr:MAG: SDR family oxidoreductase [Chloroflexota bacterium]
MTDLGGKTVLITGATSGIGLKASIALARMGARVVMVGRDSSKTAQKVAEVRAQSGSAIVDSLLCDVASQAQVHALADSFRATYDRLDVLVNNAGTVFARRTLTEDHLEATFAVNYLSVFLLTNLLLDRLIGSAPARVVNVASNGHYGGTMDFNDLGFERGYQIMRAYSRSKLAEVLFTRELARRLEGTGVTVNCVHPGAVATSIWDRAPVYARPIFALAKRIAMISPEAGAATIVYLASSPEVVGKTGLYFEKNHPKAPSRLALDDALATRLWDESAKLVELAPRPA